MQETNINKIPFRNKIIIVALSITTLTVATMSLYYSSNKMNDNVENKTSELLSTTKYPVYNYLVSTSTNSTGNLKTKYADGRISDVRKINYYNYIVGSSKPFGDTAAAKELGLTTIITEWDKYDAIVASP